MYWSRLSEVVANVQSRVETAPLSDVGLSNVRSALERIPAAAADSLVFEYQFGAAHQGIDVSFALSPRGSAWVDETRPWPAVTRLFRDVPSHYITARPRPWLEFDTSARSEKPHSPSVHFAIDRQRDGPDAPLRLIECAHTSFSVSTPIIEHCLAHVPVSVRRMYVGFLLPRSVDYIRLGLVFRAPDDLLRFLKVIGWPGDLRPVKSVLDDFRPVCPRFGLQINIGSELQPQAGVELDFTALRRDPDGTTNLAFLRRLERNGVCTLSERSLLEAWPSRTTYAAPLVDRLIEGACPSSCDLLAHGTLVTELSHIKFGFDPRLPTVAKAYVGAFLESA